MQWTFVRGWLSLNPLRNSGSVNYLRVLGLTAVCLNPLRNSGSVNLAALCAALGAGLNPLRNSGSVNRDVEIQDYGSVSIPFGIRGA